MQAALIEPGQRIAVPERSWANALKAHVLEAEQRDPSAWDFRTRTEPDGPPRLFQYPAMMVAEVQRSLISAISRERPVSSLFDPFAGSGTALVEGMRLGMAAYGQDINRCSISERARSRVVDLCRGARRPSFSPHGGQATLRLSEWL